MMNVFLCCAVSVDQLCTTLKKRHLLVNKMQLSKLPEGGGAYPGPHNSGGPKVTV